MKRTRFSKVLAMTLVFLMVMSTTAFGATGTIISNTLKATVTVSRTEKVYNETQKIWYTSIQKAIDEASGNDLIKVGAGEFTEAINITKPIQLIGSGLGQSILKPPTYTNHTLIIGNVSTYGNDLSGTTIQGFTINTPVPDQTQTNPQETSAIYLTAKGSKDNEIVIQNNHFVGLDNKMIIKGNYVGITTPYSRDIGYVKILKNRLDDLKYGMYFNSMHDILVSENTIDDTLRTGINFAGSLDIPCYNITVTTNNLLNINSAEFYHRLYDAGISFYSHGEGVVAEDNTIDLVHDDREEIYFTHPSEYITLVGSIDGTQFTDSTIVNVEAGEKVTIIISATVEYDLFNTGKVFYKIGEDDYNTDITINSSINGEQTGTFDITGLVAGTDYTIEIFVVEQ